MSTITKNLNEVLAPSTTPYEVRVKAVGDQTLYRDSAWSDYEQVTISQYSKPKNAEITNDTILSWDGVPGDPQYRIYYRDNGGSTYTLITSTYSVEIDLYTYKDSLGLNGTIMIVAHDPNGVFTDSTGTLVTLNRLLTTPYPVLSNESYVSWDAVTGAEQYKVYYYDTAYHLLDNMYSLTHIELKDYTDALPVEFKNYISVEASDMVGWYMSKKSNNLEVDRALYPPTPSINNSTGIMSWTAVTDADKYSVKIYVGPASALVSVYDSETNTTTLNLNNISALVESENSRVTVKMQSIPATDDDWHLAYTANSTVFTRPSTGTPSNITMSTSRQYDSETQTFYNFESAGIFTWDTISNYDYLYIWYRFGYYDSTQAEVVFTDWETLDSHYVGNSIDLRDYLSVMEEPERAGTMADGQEYTWGYNIRIEARKDILWVMRKRGQNQQSSVFDEGYRRYSPYSTNATYSAGTISYDATTWHTSGYRITINGTVVSTPSTPASFKLTDYVSTPRTNTIWVENVPDDTWMITNRTVMSKTTANIHATTLNCTVPTFASIYAEGETISGTVQGTSSLILNESIYMDPVTTLDTTTGAFTYVIPSGIGTTIEMECLMADNVSEFAWGATAPYSGSESTIAITWGYQEVSSQTDGKAKYVLTMTGSNPTYTAVHETGSARYTFHQNGDAPVMTGAGYAYSNCRLKVYVYSGSLIMQYHNMTAGSSTGWSTTDGSVVSIDNRYITWREY